MTETNEEFAARIKANGTDSDEELARLTEIVQDKDAAKAAAEEHFKK